jgi:hypothetical protein
MIAEYEPPTCNKEMSLSFCAQMVGTPIITPEPTTTPAVAAVPVRNVRRVTMGVRCADVPSAIILSFGSCVDHFRADVDADHLRRAVLL